MKIGLVAHDLTALDGRGLQRYTAGLARALATTPGVELVLFSRTVPLPVFDDIAARREVWLGRREVIWEQVDLPLRVWRRGIDVLHAPCNLGLPAFAPCPTVLTRHDEIRRMLPPDFPGNVRGRFRTFYAEQISIRRASRIVAVSEHSRDDILRAWKLDIEKVIVCGEGIDRRFFDEIPLSEIRRVREGWELTRPYILYVGGFERRKDVLTLLDAFVSLKQPGLMLALCGPLRGEGEMIKKRVQENGHAQQVRITGRVPDHDLPALYAGCELFVYPSRYEGFGLQAVEAMACGAPVLSSDGGSLPEIVGDAGRIFPAGNVELCAQSIKILIEDKQELERLQSQGRRRADLFRWERIIDNYLSLYQQLAA